jgi:hypothetical protein
MTQYKATTLAEISDDKIMYQFNDVLVPDVNNQLRIIATEGMLCFNNTSLLVNII